MTSRNPLRPAVLPTFGVFSGGFKDKCSRPGTLPRTQVGTLYSASSLFS